MKRKAAAIGLILVLLGVTGCSRSIRSIQQTDMESEQEEHRTPEYLEYEKFRQQWQAPEEYVMVYQTPLTAQFTAYLPETSYDKAGALYIKTRDKDMTILFHTDENGVKILQSNYRDRTQENPMRENHVFVGDTWYKEEALLTKQNEEGFSVENTGNYSFDASLISSPGIGELGTITEEPGEEGRRLTFHYSKSYLEERDKWLKQVGFYPGECISAEQSVLVSGDDVIEMQTCTVTMREQTVNLITHKEKIADWRVSRYLTRDAKEANAIFQKYLEQGPEVPEEVLEIYGKMRFIGK